MFYEISDGKIELQMCNGNHVEVPTLETPDMFERIRRFREYELTRCHWNKLIRRDFLLKNQIEFPDMPLCHDWIFCFQLVMVSDRWARIPTIANVYRYRENACSHPLNRNGNSLYGNGNQVFEKYAKDLITGTKFIEDFLNRIDFFKENPKLVYELTEYFVTFYLRTFLIKHNIGGYWLEGTLREVFNQNPSDNIPLMIHLFNLLRLNFK